MSNATLPKSWGLSEQQDTIIGGLIDFAGDYVTADDFCQAIYDEECPGPSPAKLRVLIQRCRAIVAERSGGKAEIQVMRNHGWKMTKKHAFIMKKIIAEAD